MKENLVIYGGSAPVCPKCGNGNAMLITWNSRNKRAYKCRDCSHFVKDSDAIFIYKKLDRPGMGKNSTYTTVKVIKEI